MLLHFVLKQKKYIFTVLLNKFSICYMTASFNLMVLSNLTEEKSEYLHNTIINGNRSVGMLVD